MKLRVPLREDMSADDVDNAFNDNGWTLDRAVVDNAGRPIFKRWHTDASTSVQYICDGNVGVRYILVDGHAAEATAKRIQKQLSSWSAQEVRAYAAWASAREDVIIALHLIGLVGNEEFDTEFYQHLERAAAHQDPAVRTAAMLAAGYLRWPQVTAIAQGVAENDPEAGVRVAASGVLPPAWSTAGRHP